MTLAVGLLVALVVAGALLGRARRHRVTQFPPVVELAHTSPLPRLGFKIAAISARDPLTSTTLPAQASAPDGSELSATTESNDDPTPHATPDSTLGPAGDATGTDGEAPRCREAVASVYETQSGPYAANVVHGSRIMLPDDGESDLPIRFRSDNPRAQAIAEAGDRAQDLQVAGPDGLIRIGARRNTLA